MSSRFVIREIRRIQNLPPINFTTQSMATLRIIFDCLVRTSPVQAVCIAVQVSVPRQWKPRFIAGKVKSLL